MTVGVDVLNHGQNKDFKNKVDQYKKMIDTYVKETHEAIRREQNL